MTNGKPTIVKNNDQARILAMIAARIPDAQRQSEVEPLRNLMSIMGTASGCHPPHCSGHSTSRADESLVVSAHSTNDCAARIADCAYRFHILVLVSVYRSYGHSDSTNQRCR